MTYERVTVVGGGLAGCECACQLADRDIPVVLHEMRPCVSSPAHRTDGLAELVCSNSLKSTRIDSAAGLLKEELRRMGSVLLSCAERASVPAGGALAVDRDLFSALVAQEIDSRPLIHVVRGEVTEIPEGPCVIAAGPLCSPALSDRVLNLVGGDALSFFDAAAPIVDASTIDRSIVFSQSRYDDQADGDYLNAPFTKDEYNTFIDELVRAERVVLKDFERRDLFQACQPAEEVARTGHDAIRYGAMKPVGLTDPRTGRRPWAAVQLRAKRCMHGIQSRRISDQPYIWRAETRFPHDSRLGERRVFRYGVVHRNTFVDAPHVLDVTFAVPGTQVRLAGQITGTEGYTEAIASGLLAALNTFADMAALPSVSLPRTGAFGSLVAYATNPETVDYQPCMSTLASCLPWRTARDAASAIATPRIPPVPCRTSKRSSFPAVICFPHEGRFRFAGVHFGCGWGSECERVRVRFAGVRR